MKKMYTENGQPRSPLDDIPNLETVPEGVVRALEDRLSRTCLPKVRKLLLEQATRANELRHKIIG